MLNLLHCAVLAFNFSLAAVIIVGLGFYTAIAIFEFGEARKINDGWRCLHWRETVVPALGVHTSCESWIAPSNPPTTLVQP